MHRTCCLTPSIATSRFDVLVAGAGPLRLVSTGGGFTSPIPLPIHATLRLTPGAWSPNGKVLAWRARPHAGRHPDRKRQLLAAGGFRGVGPPTPFTGFSRR